MVNNSYLDSELKSELTSSYNNYTKAHKNFVDFIRNIITDRKITERERADLDTYSSSYNTTLATLKTNMDTCLSNIAENNTAYQINNLKTQIDSDFKDLNADSKACNLEFPPRPLEASFIAFSALRAALYLDSLALYSLFNWTISST